MLVFLNTCFPENQKHSNIAHWGALNYSLTFKMYDVLDSLIYILPVQ